MAEIKQVLTSNAPKPLPVLSQALVYNGIVYCSGQVGADPVTSKLVEGSVGDRARQCLNNLKAVVEAAGSSMDNVIKVNIFLDDIENFAKVNEVYAEFFSDPKPVRTCVAVHQLPLHTDVEIECSAAVPQKLMKI